MPRQAVFIKVSNIKNRKQNEPIRPSVCSVERQNFIRGIFFDFLVAELLFKFFQEIALVTPDAAVIEREVGA